MWLHSKNTWLSAGTAAGEQASADHCSLIETALTNGVEQLGYLRYLLEKSSFTDKSTDECQTLLSKRLQQGNWLVMREYCKKI